ncbi:NAD(P)-dependent alcohol dehydrogenase [Vibrio sp. kj40-1]|uniref:NAD(P)-dependent alcohol dehydrogenase n=1 Tax=Vibrio algarum TaxID=3020714 RepID=A0ABT4YU07_9VIBR|nr:NAD(P)-dependent alcohol dehydrogenase [Vibrio sp. KJ40-1]
MKKFTIKPSRDIIQMSEFASSAVGEYEVKVQVKAVSLNYRDILNRKYSVQEIVPFSDGAGEVIAVGSKVTHLQVGDRVVGLFFPTWDTGAINQAINDVARGGGSTDGMLAQEVVGHEDSFITFPAHLSYEEASTLPCAGLTAWHGLFEHAQPAQPSQTVLIQGTGGVSIFALQLAATKGINTIVLSSSDEKLTRATEMGATHTINYCQTPDWDNEVLRLTEGKGLI